MTHSNSDSIIATSTAWSEPLWLAASFQNNGAGTLNEDSVMLQSKNHDDANLDHKQAWVGHGLMTNVSFTEAGINQKIQLAPFRDRLDLRRKIYVPLGDRSPLRALAPLFAGGQLELVAMGCWPETTEKTAEETAALLAQATSPMHSKTSAATNLAPSRWFMARLVELEALFNSDDRQLPTTGPAIQLTPYLHIGLTDSGDLSLRFLPTCHHLGTDLALSTLDGVGREFKIPAQASFIQRLAQLREMQLELRQEFAIRRSLYNALANSPMQPSQALRYFERLLDESPYPASPTPASDRLLQRRQLLKAFSSCTRSNRTSNPPLNPTLWDAYGAVAHWVNSVATGSPVQRWRSCCHGAGATLLRQALAYAVALQYDQQEAAAPPKRPRPSGAQRCLAASDALQARIQQLRQPSNHEAIAALQTAKSS